MSFDEQPSVSLSFLAHRLYRRTQDSDPMPIPLGRLIPRFPSRFSSSQETYVALVFIHSSLRISKFSSLWLPYSLAVS